MIRQFQPGDHVTFNTEVHAKNIPSLGGTTISIRQWAKGEIVKYEKKGTEEKIEDDFIGIEITNEDDAEAEEITVWVPFSEWKNLKKCGY